jgi:hypothetical protein
MRDRIPPPGYACDDPYRPYVPYTASRRAARPQDHAARGRHGFAIFHDGNAGHFWRGEVFSNLGDAMLVTGLLLWIAQLTYSPQAIAITVVMFALPWVLAGPLAVPLQYVRRPGWALRHVGNARVFFTFGLVVIQLIHYRGIFPSALYPVLYLLIFAISLCGRLREALRVAATRTCLAPGDVELVANDLQIGAAVVAVVGPLLSALLFILLGERILLVAIGVAVIYFLSANSDSFLDVQPVWRRAFSLVTPESAVEDDKLRAELLDAAQPDDRRVGAAAAFGTGGPEEDYELLVERALPEWYQMGPWSIGQALDDLRAGLGLAALANSSRTSLYVLGSLALIGGGLTVLEVFYVLYVLQVPIFYLAALLAAEGGGLALGGSMAAGMVARGSWRFATVVGLLGIGIALGILALWPVVLVALPAALLLGAANAFAVMGARHGVRTGFSGPERRALTAAEGFITALCTIAGAGIFLYFYLYLSPTYIGWLNPASNSDFSWAGPGELMLVTGVLLVLLGIGFGLSLTFSGNGPRHAPAPLPATGTSAMGAIGLTMEAEESMGYPAVGDGWDDNGPARYAPGYGYRNAGYGYDDGYEDDGRW